MLGRLSVNSSTDIGESSSSSLQSDGRHESDKKTVLDVLGKKYSTEIVAAATDPVSAKELSNELDIPPATCYRRVETLNDVGLLMECESHRETEATTYYRRAVDGVDFNFDGDLSIRTSETRPAGWTLDQIWKRITNWR